MSTICMPTVKENHEDCSAIYIANIKRDASLVQFRTLIRVQFQKERD